jgi:hypothetical protein
VWGDFFYLEIFFYLRQKKKFIIIVLKLI